MTGLIAALPDLALGATFLITWFHPATFGEKAVSGFLLLMLLEFITVHSAGFMGVVLVSGWTKRKRLLALLGLGCLYTIFVGGFALSFGEWWPVWSFWLLMANRLLGVLIGQAPEGREKVFIMASWAASVFFYVAFVFLTSFAPMPAFGLTPEFVGGLGLPGGGLWIEEPHRVIAFGFLYFLAMGLAELAGGRWLAGRPPFSVETP